MTQRDNTAQPASIMGVGWQRYVFPGIWLVYLASTADGVHHNSTGAAAVVGYAIIGVFGLVYVLAGPAGWQRNFSTFWRLYAIGVALTVAEVFFAHAGAFVFLVYLSVLIMASEVRGRLIVVATYAAITTFVPLVAGWRNTPDWSDGLTVVLVSFAMYGFFHIIRANRELSAARAEVARLAAEAERSRIARDLHDLLGHSLTAITVKAGLARRLAEKGDTRSATEIREVEQLARRTLSDVRAAVAGHNEVTLAGELATAREVLRAAAISAELPGSVDIVHPQLHELFGWVLREGVTNLVRHAHAQTCRVTIGPRWIEIADSGSGSEGGCGSGLRGLRERVQAAGGALTAVGSYAGFKLRAEVPADVELPDVVSDQVAPSVEPASSVEPAR